MMIIVAAAVATFATRAGGYVILSRFKRIHPRVNAALNAVPAAVLTTLVAPSLLNSGPAEILALCATGLLCLRTSLMPAFLAGTAMLIALRHVGG